MKTYGPMNNFEAVIGLEVHCQLATDSKIFCSCRARLDDGRSVADVEPNSATCPVCTAQPGALPVLNKKVVEYAVKAGLATNCTINLKNVFARKNYFYPDSPKGYQISQFELPICENGYLNIESTSANSPANTPVNTKDGKPAIKKIHIQRIHMEEDAGKSLHRDGYSLVNLNRAGVPLVEIVSGPEMKSPEEAGAYLRALYAVVTYIGICDGNMQEGNFRCDANVSVMPKGSTKLGTRAEVKNVNSFRFVEKAIEYEIERQIEVIESGGKIVQETRLYDSTKNITVSMRSKEEAQDYRYFPDPDLVPVHLEQAYVEQIREALPELPEQKRARFATEFGIGAQDAALIASSKSLADFFEKTIAVLSQAGLQAKSAAKPVANLMNGEITRLLNEESIEIERSKLTPTHLADLVQLLQSSVVSSTGAKQVIATVWKTGEGVNAIVEREGLKQVSDLGAIEPAVDQVIAANPAQVAEFRAGKEKLMGFFVGQVLKATGGKANPGTIQELIKKKLSSA
jgi:aspartyl-tRNA(Asn)/glutamyl-tRNA(Gln) amidotransferase subunit B